MAPLTTAGQAQPTETFHVRSRRSPLVLPAANSSVVWTATPALAVRNRTARLARPSLPDSSTDPTRNRWMVPDASPVPTTRVCLRTSGGARWCGSGCFSFAPRPGDVHPRGGRLVGRPRDPRGSVGQRPHVATRRTAGPRLVGGGCAEGRRRGFPFAGQVRVEPSGAPATGPGSSTSCRDAGR